MMLAAAAIALTVVISAVMVNIDWLGHGRLGRKGKIVDLLNVMIVLSALVFALVMVMMVYALWKFRAKPGDESDGEPIHGNTRLEVAWTLIPTIIVIFGAGYSWSSSTTSKRRQPDRSRSTSSPSSSPGASATPARATPPRASSTSRSTASSTSTCTRSTSSTPSGCPSGDQERPRAGLRPTGGDDIDNTVSVTPDVEGTY